MAIAPLLEDANGNLTVPNPHFHTHVQVSQLQVLSYLLL